MRSREIFLVLILGLFAIKSVKAQELRFNFLDGATNLNDNLNNSGNYDTIGKGGSPGGRDAGAAWETSNGDVYLFGGRGYNTVLGRLNDFWKFDGEDWIWLGGSKTENAATGKYHSAPFYPGGRSNSGACVDNQDRLWLFGGEGYAKINAPSSQTRGRLNDLWMWDGSAWQWMSGSDVINQSTDTNVASLSFGPGARRDAMMWHANNAIYVFGGNGVDASNSGNKHLMDLWRWDISSSQWTLVKGPVTYTNSNNIVYSTTANDLTNTAQQIGPRYAGAHWLDASGDLWVFGGWGRDQTGSTGRLNDLWRFDVSEGLWIWVQGSKTVNNGAITTGAASTHQPGARMGPAYWTDDLGHFWIWGGSGYAISNNSSTSYLGDAWRWDGGYWHFEGGSDQANSTGSYGALGPSSTNFPGGREFAFGFKGRHNEGHLFGGYRNNSGNDEWFDDFWRLEYGSHWSFANQWNGQIPDSTVNAYVRENISLVNNAHLKVAHLNLQATIAIGATNETNFDTLSVYGDLIMESDNLIMGEGDLRIAGAGSHSISGGGSITLRGPNLTVETGNVLTTNSKFKFCTVLNDFTKTSLINATSSSINGDVINLLYLPFNDHYPFSMFSQGNGIGEGVYHQVSTALSQVKLEQFGQGGLLRANSSIPSINTVWEYNSSAGNWVSTLALNDTISNKPFLIYAGENYSGNFLFDQASDYQNIDGSLYGVVELKGLYEAVNNNYKYTVYSDYTTTFPTSQEGWNMLVNPFSQFINIESLLTDTYFPTSFYNTNSVHLWDAKEERYYSFSHDRSLHGNLQSSHSNYQPYIMPGQVFWVQARRRFLQNNPTLFEQTVRSEWAASRIPNSGSLKRNHSDGIRMYLAEKGRVQSQESWLGFASWATGDFDGRSETVYFAGGSNKSYLYMGAGLNGEHKLTINFISNRSLNEAVPVFVGNPSGHQDVLEFSLNIDYLQSYADVLVEDLKTGEFSRPYGKDSYAFINDTAWQGPRLMLHLSNSNDLILNEKNSNELFFAYRELDNLIVKLPKELKQANLKVYAPDGRLLKSYSNLSEPKLVISGLKSRGVYLLEFSSQNHHDFYRVVY